MAELCDKWAALKKPNLWGEVPRVVEMQSEAGVAGTVHGGLLCNIFVREAHDPALVARGEPIRAN